MAPQRNRKELEVGWTDSVYYFFIFLGHLRHAVYDFTTQLHGAAGGRMRECFRAKVGGGVGGVEGCGTAESK